MLTYYGTPIDGRPATALARDGRRSFRTSGRCISGSRQPSSTSSTTSRRIRRCRSQGLRACRQLLAYLLREVAIQRQRLLDGQPVDDTMLTRLVQFQLGRSPPTVPRPPDLDPRLVSDLRIAENVMGTIVGAVAGQEEATCRVIDSFIRLQEGEYRPSGSGPYRYGSFDEARQLALDVLSGDERARRAATELHKYFLEALRLQPQGEVLLRKCARDGRTIADGRPTSGGHARVRVARLGHERRARTRRLHPGPAARALSAVRVEPAHLPRAVRLTGHHRRDDDRRCSGFRTSSGPRPGAGEPSFPFERRFGRLQLDDQNLYTTTFSLASRTPARRGASGRRVRFSPSRFGGRYASAARQKSRLFFYFGHPVRALRDGYSNSIVAWMFHLLSRISCSTSLIGVSPWPNGMFGPLFSFRSFTWTCVMRSWCCLRNGTGDVFLPATKWPMSRLAPLCFA